MTRCFEYYDVILPRQLRESEANPEVMEGCGDETLSKTQKSEILSYLAEVDKLEDSLGDSIGDSTKTRRFVIKNLAASATRPIYREQNDNVRAAALSEVATRLKSRIGDDGARRITEPEVKGIIDKLTAELKPQEKREPSQETDDIELIEAGQVLPKTRPDAVIDVEVEETPEGCEVCECDASEVCACDIPEAPAAPARNATLEIIKEIERQSKEHVTYRNIINISDAEDIAECWRAVESIRAWCDKALSQHTEATQETAKIHA